MCSCFGIKWMIYKNKLYVCIENENYESFYLDDIWDIYISPCFFTSIGPRPQSHAPKKL
jgi:hypothetical protein